MIALAASALVTAFAQAPPVPAPVVDEIVIPVLGVPRTQLRGSFLQGRVGHLHHAIDILAPRGTAVLAAVDGTVRKLFLSHDGGITLYEFDRAGNMSYYYAHLERYAPGVHEGMAVHKGDVLGYVGTTGNAPKNTPHLHFAIYKLLPARQWWKGVAIDPWPWLMMRGVTKGATQVRGQADSR